MEKDHHDNNHDYPHCPELDSIMGKRQSVAGKWALPIMLATAAIAAIVFVYAYMRISSH